MPKSATEIMQDILFSSVLDAIVALKSASGGLPNALLRDINTIHPNTAFADLPKPVQDALLANVQIAFRKLLSEGYSIGPSTMARAPERRPSDPRQGPRDGGPDPRRGPGGPDKRRGPGGPDKGRGPGGPDKGRGPGAPDRRGPANTDNRGGRRGPGKPRPPKS